ncbi:MAG: hypothetical protein G01um101429_291 [Parcubacteria group bacterium Gr01-1014_29]|nr:MAG: hypothetical protein G01um101429_291 [Parcubacteria group bacterium Gr01-1014_29]
MGKVSRREFQKSATNLRAKGLSSSDIANMKKIFRGDLDEGTALTRGIDPKELDRGVKWMRENMSKHTLSKNQVNKLEENLRKKL